MQKKKIHWFKNLSCYVMDPIIKDGFNIYDISLCQNMVFMSLTILLLMPKLSHVIIYDINTHCSNYYDYMTI